MGELPNALGQTDYSLHDFMTGYPEFLMQADQDPKVLVVWQHGDEPIGPRVGYRLYNEHPDLLEHVDYLCGNPLAASAVPARRDSVNGTDLNRSYTPGLEPKSYEQHRAVEIMKIIENNGYNYVLDLHTTVTEGGGYFIADEDTIGSQAVQDIIAASLLKRIVVFPHSIARDGLIGNLDNAISVEYEKPIGNEIGVEETVLLIRGLVSPGRFFTTRDPMEREIYRVSGHILKDEDPGDVPNFELTSEGFYPILFGNNTYRKDPSKNYLGFIATSKELVAL